MYTGPGVSAPRVSIPILSMMSPECVGCDLGRIANGGPGSVNYPAANVAIFIPFGVSTAITVVKLWVANGATISAGNIDLGLFNPDGTMVVHKGSTASSGANVAQELDITDTTLQPGRYYMAMTSDTSAATQKINCITMAQASFCSAAGVLQAASTFPLANVTLATMAQVAVPLIGISIRTVIA